MGGNQPVKHGRPCFPALSGFYVFCMRLLKCAICAAPTPPLWQVLREKLWHIYHGCSKREFAQRLRRFLECSNRQELRDSIQSRIQRIRQKSPLFQRAYDIEGVPRTSNAWLTDKSLRKIDKTLKYQCL